MQYSVLFLSVLAATGVMAAPAMKDAPPKDAPSNGFLVTLDGDNGPVTVAAKNFDSSKDITRQVKHQGPFKTVTLALGKDVANQEVRCQLLDDQATPKPVIMTRGENVDINFSKGNPWTFKDSKAVKVTSVSCGPSFPKTDQTTVREIKVTLSRKPQPGLVQTQDFSQTKFEEDKLPQEKKPEGAAPGKAFDTVRLTVGLAIKNRALRCKAFDAQNMPIIVKRGENIDFSFADGDNPNAWTFTDGPAAVTKIVCDPAFKKEDASGKVAKKPMADAPVAKEAPEGVEGEDDVAIAI
jgi:hypothetical protein